MNVQYTVSILVCSMGPEAAYHVSLNSAEA
jgi:hypothetical protein